MIRQPDTPARLPLIAALGAAAGFVALQMLAFLHAGLFEYPLDDVYIHMAMAEGIWQGTYGINPGEAASAASSILYPLLLLPIFGPSFQWFLPLFWNSAAILALGWQFGRVLEIGGARGRWGMALAALAPLGLNMPGVAYLGMEHTLHALVTVTILLELYAYLSTGRISRLLVATLILGPLLRYEGLALSLAAAGVIALRGRPGLGLGLMAAIAAPVGLFSLYLTHLGLDPLPGSVLVKATLGDQPFSPMDNFTLLLTKPSGIAVLALIALLYLMALLLFMRRMFAGLWLAVIATIVGVAHALVGQVGWLYRYEDYVVVLMVSALILGCRGLSRRWFWGVALVLAGLGAHFSPKVWGVYAWNSRAVNLQQVQMAHLANDLLKAPVAANDIGHLAWNSDNYILDLWGLANADARRARLVPGGQAQQGWADRLTRAKGIGYALVYPSWIGAGIGADWIAVAHLTMEPANGELGSFDVALYATDAAHVAPLQAAVQALQPDLPEGAVLTMVAP